MMGPDAQRSWKADPAQAAAGCGASRSSLTSSEGAVAVSRSRMRGEAAAAARLQAVVRGYLIRKRLQSIRSKYESIVKEIEGDLDWVQWTGHFFPRPAFLSKSAKKSIKPFNREKVKIDKPQKQDAQYFQEISQSKQMCDFEMQFPSRLLAEVEPKEPKISEVGQQAVDAHSGNVCSLSGENEEGGEPSNASSDWSSTVLGMESPRMSQESHFPKAPEMLRGMPGLQNYRKHLAMELLWLQQAIASRKNYLILKHRLGKPA
ncbi:IQ domain-containing protein C isoform X2 [Pantherophis guttatus]|uniref:IQ domain-containing protein C isoform X2 n=1 Tax=Pantherophis guttatus TaxID=94885 RepID=A0A6P9BM82_PANGU|nr:IQ domain-containing protein C isoform X2 [Pantherophis guttatus]